MGLLAIIETNGVASIPEKVGAFPASKVGPDSY